MGGYSFKWVAQPGSNEVNHTSDWSIFWGGIALYAQDIGVSRKKSSKIRLGMLAAIGGGNEA
jgi:hypothetical protein